MNIISELVVRSTYINSVKSREILRKISSLFTLVDGEMAGCTTTGNGPQSAVLSNCAENYPLPSRYAAEMPARNLNPKSKRREGQPRVEMIRGWKRIKYTKSIARVDQERIGSVE